MKFNYNYTPRNWEFGFGFYKGKWFIHAIYEKLTKYPDEYYLMLGPYTLTLYIGYKTEVINGK